MRLAFSFKCYSVLLILINTKIQAFPRYYLSKQTNSRAVTLTSSVLFHFKTSHPRFIKDLFHQYTSLEFQLFWYFGIIDLFSPA